MSPSADLSKQVNDLLENQIPNDINHLSNMTTVPTASNILTPPAASPDFKHSQKRRFSCWLWDLSWWRITW